MNEFSTHLSSDSALYALGLLSSDEQSAFLALVAAGAVNMSELRDVVSTVTKLSEAHAARMPAPRPALRAAILARAAAGEKHSPMTVVRDETDNWQLMAPGIEIKSLFVDVVNGIHTVLARLAPGAAYPKHRHVGDEQCYVVEGDLFTDGVLLHGGDFIATTNGTIHTDTHTDTGCLLLLATQLQDEVIG